jgi:hypothetical protein
MAVVLKVVAPESDILEGGTLEIALAGIAICVLYAPFVVVALS